MRGIVMDKEEEVRTSLQLYSHRITRKSSLRYDLHCHSFFEIYYVVCGDCNIWWKETITFPGRTACC